MELVARTLELGAGWGVDADLVVAGDRPELTGGLRDDLG